MANVRTLCRHKRADYFEDSVFATVPTEYKDRKIEAFVPGEKTFSDIEKDGDYYDIEWLAYTDVIRGDEKNMANPEKNLTRAEAVTMTVRFFGLENVPVQDEKKPFDDVDENAWYAKYVAVALEKGIITNENGLFSANESVTRQEIALMVYNALKYANLSCPSYITENIADFADCSDVAKEAFEYIGSGCVYEFSETETDFENPKSYLFPEKTATRAYMARMLSNIQGICQIYPTKIAEKYGFDKEMPIIDGSTSTYPFTEAVYGSMFSNSRTHEQFPEKHSKTHTSYERLINGEVDMLFASHHPANDIVELAKESGVEFELVPIAYDAMIFFTNADNPISGITKEQISDIYVNNAYSNWSQIGGEDALLYAYCRNSDSGSHAQMEKHFLNGNEIHPDIQKETSYTMTNVLTDVMDAQTDNPKGYGLGYSIYYFFNNMDVIFETKTKLKLLAIDTVMPNDETIADGSYPLSNNTYIVLRKDTPLDSPARKMVEFMLSDEGQKCVEQAGYGALGD